MAKVSMYLKGSDRFPDLGYPQRLREFSQQVNPKPGYVAEPTKEHPITEWMVHVTYAGETYSSKVTGSYLDMAITRAIRSLPMGITPAAGEQMTITFEPAE